MNMKSVTDFLKESNDTESLKDYLSSFLDDKKVIDSFMLEFQNPYFLAGPYDQKYGLVLIQDHRLGNKKLLPEIAHYKKWVDYCMTNRYNLPHYLVKELNLESREYFAGYYDQESGSPIKDDDYVSGVHYSMFEENVDPESESLNHPFIKKHVCSPGNFNALELLSAFEIMIEKDGIEKTLQHIASMKEKIQTDISRFERRSCVSIEKPFYLHLAGTDDASWGASFKKLEDLNIVLSEIKKNPSSQTVHKYLDFTN